ncbi:hypothetical protein ACLOJK_005227 [Asimina triloba]
MEVSYPSGDNEAFLAITLTISSSNAATGNDLYPARHSVNSLIVNGSTPGHLRSGPNLMCSSTATFSRSSRPGGGDASDVGGLLVTFESMNPTHYTLRRIGSGHACPVALGHLLSVTARLQLERPMLHAVAIGVLTIDPATLYHGARIKPSTTVGIKAPITVETGTLIAKRVDPLVQN